ncbi:MAG TPA: hypothetical protein VKZ50_03235 [bacterium]|nr:hypothetical protein [bacterium]
MTVGKRWAVLTMVVAAVGLVGSSAGWMESAGRADASARANATGATPVATAAPLLAAAAPAAAGKTAYTAGTAQLRKDPGGAVVGTLTPGTPVSVTESRGTDAHVSVQGWSAAGSNTVVAAVGVRIALANLSAPDQAQRQTGSQTKDSYGTVWTQVTISGWVAANALTADVQTVWTHGRQVYEAHCSTCHSLYATDQYTANQWPGNIQNMADRAGLSGDDLSLVLKYLQTHAKAQ